MAKDNPLSFLPLLSSSLHLPYVFSPSLFPLRLQELFVGGWEEAGAGERTWQGSNSQNLGERELRKDGGKGHRRVEAPAPQYLGSSSSEEGSRLEAEGLQWRRQGSAWREDMN